MRKEDGRKMLHPTKPSRERILLFGPWNGGKSSAWLSVLKWLKDSTTHFYLYDSDNAWDRYQEMFDTPPSNITVIDVGEYGDVYPSIEKHRKEAGKDDWLVVDMGHGLLEMAEDAFIEAAHGVNSLDWITKAVTSKDGRGGAYGINWSGRKKYYGRVMSNVQRWPGHVVFCCAEQEVKSPVTKRDGSTDSTFADAKEIRDLFGRIGYRPQGDDNLPHMFHTVLRMTSDGNKWYMTTVKERVVEKREKMAGKEVADFVSSYLVPVAGWSLT